MSSAAAQRERGSPVHVEPFHVQGLEGGAVTNAFAVKGTQWVNNGTIGTSASVIQKCDKRRRWELTAAWPG